MAEHGFVVGYDDVSADEAARRMLQRNFEQYKKYISPKLDHVEVPEFLDAQGMIARGLTAPEFDPDQKVMSWYVKTDD